MKQYVVYFFIKANRMEYLADVVVEAPTAKAACKLCKEWYFNRPARTRSVLRQASRTMPGGGTKSAAGSGILWRELRTGGEL